jgi:hypothetical protein
VIGLLLALHPRAWRARYGEELRDLLAQEPLTARVVLDVLLNAARQQVAVHALAARVAVALAISVVVEVLAVRAHVTANILWPPGGPVRTCVLAAPLLPWVPVARRCVAALRSRRAGAPVRG